MNFFGIGGWELVFFLLIALIVAGPRRMIQWAYTAGVYLAKFRRIWAETMTLIEKEFKQAGVDIEVPKELPTGRGAVRQQINKAFKPITQPIEDTVGEVNANLRLSEAPPKNSNGSAPVSQTAEDANNKGFGTWSGKVEK